MKSKIGTPTRIRIVSQPNLSEILRCYPKMVLRSAQVYLHKPELKPNWFTVIAEKDSTRLGLIVALLSRQQSVLEIVSWYVPPEFSMKGLGQRLLAELEDWCRNHGIKEMTFDLRDSNRYYEVATHILKKLRWCDQHPLVHRFKVAASTLQNLHWEQYQRKATKVKIFSWQSLSDLQRIKLVEKSRSDPDFPVELLPVNSEHLIENRVSLGLSLEDEVIGWLIAHHHQRDLIEYSMLYVKPSQRSSGATIMLLGESFKRLTGIGVSNVIFQVKVDNNQMLRFVRNRFHPILSEATLFRFKKVLALG